MTDSDRSERAGHEGTRRTEPRPYRVVIVGGGVAGLSTAWRILADPELGEATPTAPCDPALSPERLRELRERVEVTILECRDRLGGNIHSEHDSGFIVEWGPNGFLDNAPETPRLCRLLGITSRVLPARDAAAHRFLYTRGKLRALPLSPGSFFLGDLLTLPGKLRVLKEPFIPGRADPAESVFSFASRRIGEEAARVLVDAMVSGVYGGNARELSLLSAFPKMYNLEKEHGGLVRGMMARARARRRGDASAGGGPMGPGGVLTSFDEGLEVLITSLEQALRGIDRCAIHTQAVAKSLDPAAGPGAGIAGSADPPSADVPSGASGTSGISRWVVRLEDGRAFPADAVVLALPSRHAGALVRGFDPGLCSVLQSIPDAPLVVAGLAWPAADLPSPPDGFGFLIPRGEGPRSLGVLWDSCIYPNRAPEGWVLMRAMVGGAHDRAAFELNDAEVLATVRKDLALTMGLEKAPSRIWILRHRHGIPQYTLGHPERLEEIDAGLRRRPGVRIAGNSYRGISVNHCVEESIGTGREILRGIPAR